jgi:hypothetical protein
MNRTQKPALNQHYVESIAILSEKLANTLSPLSQSGQSDERSLTNDSNLSKR